MRVYRMVQDGNEGVQNRCLNGPRWEASGGVTEYSQVPLELNQLTWIQQRRHSLTHQE